MSLPRYPNYKDSGVEWLGEVPGHWEVISIKWLSPVRRGASPRPIDDPKYFDEEGEFSWVRIADVSACDGVLNETTQRLSALGSSLSVKMAPGELFVSIAGTVGKPCISAIKACIHDGFVYFPMLQINPVFLYRVFEGGTCYGGLGKWGTQLNLNTDTIGSIRVALPPPEELNQVLAFLDRETAKIDELVAEQRQLMALLQEKRQAVISHAVTRGLNPHAPLKPSGIEWLGEVPEHWDVLKGSLIGTLFGSEQVPEESVTDEGDLPFIKVGSMSSDSFEIESWNWFVDTTVASRYKPRSGFIVFPKRGAAIFNNKVNVVDRPALIDPNLMGWEIGERAVTAFIAYALKARKIDELADVSTVPQINNKHIGPERFPVPPLPEQRPIVDFLGAELAKLDTLTTEAQRAIDLLQERRTALISAAVTGQTDVRSTVAA